MRFLKKVALTALVLIGWAQLFPDQLSIIDWQAAVFGALVLGVLNGLVAPLLKVLSFPLTILTLGLWLFVLDALMLLLMTHFVFGIFISGFFSALLLAVVISVVNTALSD